MVNWKRDLDSDLPAVSTVAFAAARNIAPGAADPLIAFAEDAWRALLDHVGPSPVEVGGLLAGTAARDPRTGRVLIEIVAALPARGALETATYFQLTPDAWDHMSRAREERGDDLPLIGWYHSHPGLGVFYSGTDRASQRAFCRQPWNLGLVIDPADNDWAVFLGPESERLPAGHVAWFAPVPAVAPAGARHEQPDTRSEIKPDIAKPPGVTTAGPIPPTAPDTPVAPASRARQRARLVWWAGAGAMIWVLAGWSIRRWRRRGRGQGRERET